MNQKCALCMSLLKGEVLSIMVGFRWFAITNVPREIGRSIERAFDVEVDRKDKEFTSKKYNQTGHYTEYRLLRTEKNKDGILRMQEYVRKITGKDFNPPVKRGKKLIELPDQIKTLDLFAE